MKDYIIVETNENILSRFNSLFIEILEDIEKKDYYKIQQNYDQLKRIYNKFSLDYLRKKELGILLSEIGNKIRFDILKERITKKLKKHKLI